MLVFLDDLQWSDEATLELLAGLAPALGELPRWCSAPTAPTGSRATTSCAGCASSCAAAATCTSSRPRRSTSARRPSCSRALLPGRPSPALACALHDRTQGLPFFVEELARALVVSGRLQAGSRGLELGGDEDVPAPDTVRDAVLMSAGALSDDARAAVEAAAVAGQRFDLHARRPARERGRAGRAAASRDPARGGRRARRVPARAELGGVLRRRAVAAPPRAAPGARRGARGERRHRDGARHPLARRPRRRPRPRGARARGARVRGALRLPRRDRRRPPGARAVAGRRGARGPASRCSSATRAAPSSPASCPRR